jgi:flagellar protein FlbD
MGIFQSVKNWKTRPHVSRILTLIDLMIQLTKLNGEEFVLNAEMIRYVERCPDTLISLMTGETIMVSEPMDEVVRRTISYQQSKFMFPQYLGQEYHRRAG